jgi:hypothetical protein
MEIMCHSRTHGVDPLTFDEFVDETSTPAEEMRRIGLNIYQWVQPGGWTAAYSFNGTDHYGLPPDVHMRRFFRQYEAYIIACPASPYWTLPRTLQWGTVYGPIYAPMTLAQAEAAVDAAIVAGTGIEGMWHPSLFDGAGWSKADFEAFLDYVAVKVAAGDLVVMTMINHYFAVPA